MNEDLNVVLALIVCFIAATALLFWVSPRGLDWLIVRLRARSEALRQAREVYRNTHRAAMEVESKLLSETRQHGITSAARKQRSRAPMRVVRPDRVAQSAAPLISDGMDRAMAAEAACAQAG